MSKNFNGSGTFNVPGYNSFSGCDMIVTARLTSVSGYEVHEKTYSLGSLQTLSISTHQDKRPVRALGNMNAIDYTMGQRTIAGSMVFAVFDRHFANEMFEDLKKVKGDAIILADELPPLDITITFANEYGRTSRMALYGVRLINEGQVMSVNDIFTENTYQFVANSLEPLNPGNSSGSSSNSKQKTLIETASMVYKDFGSIGEDIVYHIYNNNISLDAKNITLSVEVEQATNNYSLGIAKFQLSPKQIDGRISIHNTTNGKDVNIFLKDLTNYNYIYKELPQGKYIATYYGEEEYIYSNTVTFTLENSNLLNNDKYDQPIIESIGHNYIQVLSNNQLHTHVEYYMENGLSRQNEIKVIELKSKKALLTDLMPNTSYIIRTTDLTNGYSKYTKVKTYSFEKQNIILFLEYVYYNQNLLKEKIEKYEDILTHVKNTQHDNLIDAITSYEKSILTQELLLFATKFQNELNVLFNSLYLSTPIKSISSPFWNTIKHDDLAIKANYFYVKKNKNYFDSSISYPTIEEFKGISNKRYYTYDILNDSSRGIRYDFTCISEEDKSELEQYKQVDLISQLDISKYKNIYPKVSTRTLYEIAARETKQPNIRVLNAPYIQYNETLEMIEVDFDYNHILGKSEELFYLCISDINEALDYTPVRKIAFESEAKTKMFDKYTTGVINNKTYLAWIEDSNYNSISYSSIFKTNSDSTELESTEYQDAHKEYTSIKRKLEAAVGKKQIIDTVFSYVNSFQSIQKRLYDSLEQEFINYSNNIINFDAILFELLKIKFDKNHYIKQLEEKVIFNKKSKTVEFLTNKKCHIAKIEYAIDETYPSKDSLELDIVRLDNSKSYTVLYLVEKSYTTTSGFILINNATGTYYSYNLKMEVI